MNKNLISKAADKLELMNILLHESSLERCELDPLLYPDLIDQQGMLSISFEEASYSNEDEDFNIFRAYVNLGVRAVKSQEKNVEEDEVLFTIESTFRVEYIENEKLTKKEAEEFSKFNSVHNVWPFWRKHVFDEIGRAHV